MHRTVLEGRFSSARNCGCVGDMAEQRSNAPLRPSPAAAAEACERSVSAARDSPAQRIGLDQPGDIGLFARNIWTSSAFLDIGRARSVVDAPLQSSVRRRPVRNVIRPSRPSCASDAAILMSPHRAGPKRLTSAWRTAAHGSSGRRSIAGSACRRWLSCSSPG